MDRDVKPRRTYDGAARQARTRRTWAAVVEAAQSLFVERGYAATTIEAISDRSDTPQATVYRLFSSKLGILKALLDVSIGVTTGRCPWRIARRSAPWSPTPTRPTS